MTVLSVLDAAGRRRSPATLPGYHAAAHHATRAWSRRDGPSLVEDSARPPRRSQRAHRLTREGRIPVVKLGRYYRYRPDAIDHFERRGLDEPLERHSPARLEAI